MGVHVSSIKQLLYNQKAKEVCYPVTPYSRLSKTLWPAQDNDLVFDIHVYPEKLQRVTDSGSWYWWTDAQFLPFNDTCLFASASAFLPRPTQHWIAARSMPNGRVLLYRFEKGIQCEIFSRTTCSVYPKMQPHPLGQLVCYCGTGEVAVLGLDATPVFNRSRDLTNAVHVFCAVANNGIHFACLKRGMGVFFLESYLLDTTMLQTASKRCQNICPGFTPSKSCSENVRCKFSPDSKYITVSSSAGFLFTVRKQGLEKFCIICPDMVEEVLSSAASFDYSPRFAFEVITLGTADGNILTVNIETSEILLSVTVENEIDCLHYSPDGLTLAVAFNNFDLAVYNSRDLTCTHAIPMSTVCDTVNPRVQPNFQAVLNLSFSQNGEHLVSTSCDGHLRMWRIPKVSTLQELCRDVILSCLPVRKVNCLQLPNKMKDFLMFKFF